MPPPNSDVWKYFDHPKPGQHIAKCKICGKGKKTSGNTSNLFAHLKLKHCSQPKLTSTSSSSMKVSTETAQGDLVGAGASIGSADLDPHDQSRNVDDEGIEAMMCLSSTSAGAGPSGSVGPVSRKPYMVQTTVSKMLTSVSSFAEGGTQNLKITSAIAEYIIMDNLPFSTVEGDGFLRLMKTLHPRYKVPTRNTIKQVILEKYDCMSGVFKTVLVNINHFSLTTDIWSDFQMRSYLGVTIHFIHNLKIVSVSLGAVNLGDSHTAEYISAELIKLLEYWGIPQEKILAVVTDNGANMVKAIATTFTSNRHVRCLGHTLNLVCDNSLQVEGVKDIVAQVRSIVVAIKNSTRASDEMRKYFIKEGVPEGNIKKMILDVKTRWNSTFYMLKRFIEVLPAVRHLSILLNNFPPMVSPSNVEVIKEILSILEPIEKVTVEISAEKYVTLSKVIPMVKCVLRLFSNVNIISPAGILLKEKVEHEMNKRFEKIEDNFLLAASTLLDPRFKNIHLESTNSLANLFRQIRNIMKKNHSDIESSSDSDGTVPATVDLWAHHKNVAHQAKKMENSDELTQYLETPVCSLNQNPILVWENLKMIFPKLYELAEKVLYIPATSVPCERLFSKAGATVSLTRNRLSPKTISKLLFLQSWPDDIVA